MPEPAKSRDEVALAIFLQLVARPDTTGPVDQLAPTIATLSYQFADAFLAARATAKPEA